MYYTQPSGETSAIYSGPLGNGMFGIWIQKQNDPNSDLSVMTAMVE